MAACNHPGYDKHWSEATPEKRAARKAADAIRKKMSTEEFFFHLETDGYKVIEVDIIIPE